MVKRSSGDVISLAQLEQVPLGIADDQHVWAALLEARRYGEEHPEVFAGIVPSGRTLFIGFTRDPSAHLSSLHRALPEAQIRAFEAEYTLKELDGMAERIAKDMTKLQQEGIHIWSIGVVPERNRVEVGLSTLDKAWMDGLRARYDTGMLLFRKVGRAYALDHAQISRDKRAE